MTAERDPTAAELKAIAAAHGRTIHPSTLVWCGEYFPDHVQRYLRNRSSNPTDDPRAWTTFSDAERTGLPIKLLDLNARGS